jgi:hypothetical protein
MMMRLLLVVALACAAFRVSEAQTSRIWGKVAGWEIKEIPVGGGGFCLAFAEFDTGESVSLAVRPDVRQVVLTLFHDRWKSVVPGQTYAVEFFFDQARGAGQFTGVDYGTRRAIEASLSWSGLRRFRDANTMTIVYNGLVISKISLAGTGAMVAELTKCQYAVAPNEWPFGSSDDPFRH